MKKRKKKFVVFKTHSIEQTNEHEKEKKFQLEVQLKKEPNFNSIFDKTNSK